MFLEGWETRNHKAISEGCLGKGLYHTLPHLPPCFLKVSSRMVQWLSHTLSLGFPLLPVFLWLRSSRKVWLSLVAQWARRIGGSWRLLEALVGSRTKLRIHGMWERAARRLCPQFPQDKGQTTIVPSWLHFPWCPLHSCCGLFLLHTSLETFHVVPTVNGVQNSKTIPLIYSCYFFPYGCNFNNLYMYTQYITIITFTWKKNAPTNLALPLALGSVLACVILTFPKPPKH